MRPALQAEWTKLRTVPGPLWLLLGLIGVTVALSAGAASVVGSTGGCAGDPTRLSLTGVDLGQTAAAVLGVLVISGEHSTGLIGTTLTAMPRRSTVLAAKAVTVAGVVGLAGAAAVLGALLAGRALLPCQSSAAPGQAGLSLADGPTLRAAVGSVLYLVLIALFSLGVATVVRDSAVGIGVVLGVLYLVPVLAQVIGDPEWQRRLEQVGPMSAGLAVQATTDLQRLPIGPWAGLGVTAGWAAIALATGGLVLRGRDA